MKTYLYYLATYTFIAAVLAAGIGYLSGNAVVSFLSGVTLGGFAAVLAMYSAGRGLFE